MAETLKQQLSRIHESEQRASSLTNKICLVQAEMLSRTSSYGPWYKDCLLTIGSQKEGGLYARVFQHGKRIHEADFMFLMGSIADPKTQLEPIQDAPGYFAIRSKGILGCFHRDVLEKFLRRNSTEHENDSDYLARSLVLEMTRNMFNPMPAEGEINANAYVLRHVDMVFQPQTPCKATVAVTQKGPSVVTDVLFQSDGQHVFQVSVDTVPCFELSSWPDDWGFQTFLNRNRNWPSNPQILKRVQQMVHIVPKASPKLKAKCKGENCWRLSFSQAEMFLKSLFSHEENHVYLLFKILFYANVKKIEIHGKRMASYFCKTTMFWTMEEEGREFCKGDLLQAVKTLFEKFKYFLNSDSGLPNFFYPATNLIDGYPKDLVRECSKMAENIIEEPLKYLPSNFEGICAQLEEIASRIEELHLEYLFEPRL